MRMDMGEAVARAVPAALEDMGRWSRGGRGMDRPAAAPVLAGIAAGLTEDFIRTESRASLALDAPYETAVAAAGVEVPAALAGRRAGLIVWNHRGLPRGAVEVLTAWEPVAVEGALARLAAFNAACGPEAGGTVRYGLLVVLSFDRPPRDMPAGPRVLAPAPVAWEGGREVHAVVLDLATEDAPTPCQLAEEAHPG